MAWEYSCLNVAPPAPLPHAIYGMGYGKGVLIVGLRSFKAKSLAWRFSSVFS